MGLFEERIEAGMQCPEFRAGYEEAEAEVRAVTAAMRGLYRDALIAEGLATPYDVENELRSLDS